MSKQTTARLNHEKRFGTCKMYPPEREKLKNSFIGHTLFKCPFFYTLNTKNAIACNGRRSKEGRGVIYSPFMLSRAQIPPFPSSSNACHAGKEFNCLMAQKISKVIFSLAGYSLKRRVSEYQNIVYQTRCRPTAREKLLLSLNGGYVAIRISC